MVIKYKKKRTACTKATLKPPDMGTVAPLFIFLTRSKCHKTLHIIRLPAKPLQQKYSPISTLSYRLDLVHTSYVSSHLRVSSHQREGVINVVVVGVGDQKPVSLVDTLGNGVGALTFTTEWIEPTFSCWK